MECSCGCSECLRKTWGIWLQLTVHRNCEQVSDAGWAKCLGDMREFRFPVLVVISLEYPIWIVSLVNQVWFGQGYVSKSSCKTEVPALLLAIKVPADLWRVFMAIRVLAGCFDVVDVQVFGNVS